MSTTISTTNISYYNGTVDSLVIDVTGTVESSSEDRREYICLYLYKYNGSYLWIFDDYATTSSWSFTGDQFTFHKIFSFSGSTTSSINFEITLYDEWEDEEDTVYYTLHPYAFGSLLIDTSSKRAGIGLTSDFSTEPSQSLSVGNIIYERGQPLSRMYGIDYIKSYMWPILGRRP